MTELKQPDTSEQDRQPDPNERRQQGDQGQHEQAEKEPPEDKDVDN